MGNEYCSYMYMATVGIPLHDRLACYVARHGSVITACVERPQRLKVI